MSFTYVLSTSTGKARLKLADTGGVAPGATATEGYAFEDEEWAEFLTEGGSVNAAVGLAARALLADAARRERAYKLPDFEYDDKGKVAALKELIKLYGGELPTVSVRCPQIDSDLGFIDPIPTVVL